MTETVKREIRRSQVVNEPKSLATRTGIAIERETQRRRRSGIRLANEAVIVERSAKKIGTGKRIDMATRIESEKRIGMVKEIESVRRIRTDMESQRSDGIRNGMAKRKEIAIGIVNEKKIRIGNAIRTGRESVIRVASIGNRHRERTAKIRRETRKGKGRRGAKSDTREGEVLMRLLRNLPLQHRLRPKSRMRMTMMMGRMRTIRVVSVQHQPRVHDRTLNVRKARPRDKRSSLTSKLINHD